MSLRHQCSVSILVRHSFHIPFYKKSKLKLFLNKLNWMKILDNLPEFVYKWKILKRSQKIRITTGHAPLSCHRNESADANNNKKNRQWRTAHTWLFQVSIKFLKTDISSKLFIRLLRTGYWIIECVHQLHRLNSVRLTSLSPQFN